MFGQVRVRARASATLRCMQHAQAYNTVTWHATCGALYANHMLPLLALSI